MKPLEGIKVIDMSQFVAAPVCGRILAEWGADVIKVEMAKGDPSRLNGTMARVPILGPDENPCFDSKNIGKRFTSIDLKTADGLAIMEKLLDTADVLLMSIRQPSAKRIGLDWETVHKRWPRIVYAFSTGFGEEGPDKDVAGYDYTAFGAKSGFINAFSPGGESPANFMPAVGDYTTGMAMAAGVMAALFGREKTGVGDKVSASLYNCAMFVLGYGFMGYEGGMRYPVSRSNMATPVANSYQCKDGSWIQFCATPYNSFYNKLMSMIGREDLVDSPLYSDHITIQKENRCPEVIKIIEEQVKQKNCDEWIKIFREADIPCEKISSFKDVIEDPQAWGSHALENVKYPSGNRHILVNLPIRLESIGYPTLEGRTGRRIGADTREVLREYGYTDAEIDKFVDEKAIID